jgi:hypothetical protein
LLEVADEDAFRPSCKQPRQVGLPQVQWQLPQILSIQGQEIEGVEHYLVVMFPRVQAVEIGDAVDTEQYRLAIDDEGGLAVAQRGFGGGYGTGAPKGKANGQWKHGRYSHESIELRRLIRKLMREARATMAGAGL